MLFQNTMRNLMMGRGVHTAFATTFGITVYQGTQPSADAITQNWSNYNSASANYLVHYLAAGMTRPIDGFLLQLGIPAAQLPTKTGTGSWCIFWTTDPTQALIDGTVLPSTSFIVGKVSDANGDGILRFTDLSFVSGVSKVILDGSIAASF